MISNEYWKVIANNPWGLECHAPVPGRAVPWPVPAHPTWRPFQSFGTPRPKPWISLIHWIDREVPNAISVFVCAHFDPFRFISVWVNRYTENKSVEWTVVTNRTDSVNSVDGHVRILFTVVKFTNIEMLNCKMSTFRIIFDRKTEP